MLEVPRVNTPLPPALIPALITGAFDALGRRLTATETGNLAALVAIETGRGGKMQNRNVGNISAGPSYPGPVWRPPWFDDTSHPLHASMRAGRAPSAFRAYDSFDDGARDFARLLLAPAYAPLMRAANQLDADTFRAALSERYSPDYRDPRSTATLRALQKEFGLDVPTGGASAGLLLLILGVGLWLRSRSTRKL